MGPDLPGCVEGAGHQLGLLPRLPHRRRAVRLPRRPLRCGGVIISFGDPSPRQASLWFKPVVDPHPRMSFGRGCHRMCIASPFRGLSDGSSGMRPLECVPSRLGRRQHMTFLLLRQYATGRGSQAEDQHCSRPCRPRRCWAPPQRQLRTTGGTSRPAASQVANGGKFPSNAALASHCRP